MLNIAILDADAWVCKGVSDYFSTPGIRTFSCHSLQSLRDSMRHYPVQILVSELLTEEDDLFNCVHFLREQSLRHPEVRLIIYTHLTDPVLLRFLQCYIPTATLMLKRDQLLRLASAVFSRNATQSVAYGNQADVWRAVREETCLLTPREFTLLEQLASGQAYKVIARSIDLSTKTISYYKLRIMNKLGCRNTAEFQRRLHGFGLFHDQSLSDLVEAPRKSA